MVKLVVINLKEVIQYIVFLIYILSKTMEMAGLGVIMVLRTMSIQECTIRN